MRERDRLPEEDREEALIAGYIQMQVFSRLRAADPKWRHRVYTKLINASQVPESDVSLCTEEVAREMFGVTGDVIDYEKHLGRHVEEVAEQHFDHEAVVSGSLVLQGGIYSAEEVASLLGRSVQTVSRLFNQKKLLGVQLTMGSTSPRYYPKWQFLNSRILAGLDVVIEELGNNGAQAIRFLLKPRPELGEETPLHLLQQGKLDEVLSLLRGQLQNIQQRVNAEFSASELVAGA